jgi:hypothetical protein
MEDMDFETLSSELIRAVRGRRSQAALSRHLGYRSNVVYAWESGRAWPTAADFFGGLRRLGKPVGPSLRQFYQLPSEAELLPELHKAEGVAALLNDLRGRTTVNDLARAAHRSRFAVARWLKGQAELRLPDFLRIVQCATQRLLDFLACFVDPSTLPSVASAWRALESARRLAYEMPWSQAVLRVLELESYRKLPRHEPGFIADWLQISREQEERCIALLLETGQVQKKRGRLVPGAAMTVDTRRDATRSREMKACWAEVALARLRAGQAGTFSYNLFSVSRKDFGRIQELHRAFFRELRRIVAESEPTECIALANVHLLEIGPAKSSNDGAG